MHLGKGPQGQAQLLRNVAWEQLLYLRERWSFPLSVVHRTGIRLGVWVWSPVSCLVGHPHMYIQPAHPPAMPPPWEQGSRCRKNQRCSPCGYRVKGPLSMRMAFCLRSGIESSLWFWSSCYGLWLLIYVGDTNTLWFSRLIDWGDSTRASNQPASTHFSSWTRELRAKVVYGPLLSGEVVGGTPLWEVLSLR